VKKIVDKVTKLLQGLLGDKEPAVVGGLIAAAGIAATLALAGDFADGVSGVELGAILAPVLTALGIRQAVSPATVVRRRS
jgi:C4-dicarboxylate transporter